MRGYYNQKELEYVGNWGRKIRKKRKYTQEQLAERAKISYSSLLRFEQGRHVTSSLILLKIMNELQITYQEYSELLDGWNKLEEKEKEKDGYGGCRSDS